MKNKKLTKSFKKNHNSEIRKDFFKRLLYIGICIIPILIFANNKDEFRLVPLPFFLFGMYQLILIVGQSQLIVDDFFPPKTYDEKTTKLIDKFIYYFSMTLFFGGLVFEIFEIRVIDNTINGTTFFWKSAFIGLAIAALLTIILKLTNSSVYDESSRRYSVHFGLFIGFFLFVPAIASYINHTYSENNENCKAYEIVRKSTGGKRNKSSWLFLKIDYNSEERFDVSRSFYDKVSEGGQVKLCTKKGKLGYEVVESFKRIDK